MIKITLKLYASLSDYLPTGTIRHSVEVEIAENESPHQVLDRFNVPRRLVHLVLLNGVYLEMGKRDEARFIEGDTLAIWPPVAGG